jgi:hypothetical protein
MVIPPGGLLVEVRVDTKFCEMSQTFSKLHHAYGNRFRDISRNFYEFRIHPSRSGRLCYIDIKF